MSRGFSFLADITTALWQRLRGRAASDDDPTTESEARRLALVLCDRAIRNWNYKIGKQSKKAIECNKSINSIVKLKFTVSLNTIGSRWSIVPAFTMRHAEAIKIYHCDWDRRFDQPLSVAPLIGTSISSMAGDRNDRHFFVDVDTNVDELERDLIEVLDSAHEYLEKFISSRENMLRTITDDQHWRRVCLNHYQRIRAAVALSVLEGRSKAEVIDLYQRLLETAQADRFPINRLPEFLSCVLRRHFDE